MKFWIGVASRDHVLNGIDGGYCQLCHGKAQPLQRMNPGDWILYYSSTEKLGGTEPCQKFTAIGEVTGDCVYEIEMAPGYMPHRRDVLFLSARSVDIRPLIPQLSFIRDKTHWGSVFRFGFLEIPRVDFVLVATKMTGVDPTVAIDSYQNRSEQRVALA